MARHPIGQRAVLRLITPVVVMLALFATATPQPAAASAGQPPSAVAVPETLPATGAFGPAATATRPLTAAGLSRLCGRPAADEGTWANVDANSPGIARIELRGCEPVTTCDGDVCSITHDAGWRTRAFGKCTPTNCDWGWSAGTFRLSSGKIYAYYNPGFAKRYVYSAMSQYRPGQLWVYWRTDFVDPSRADYEKHEWFTRAS